jgi:Ca2+-binding EF-hand superfamily protein
MGAKGRDAGTAEEIATYHKLFNRLDQDQDGRLSREEYVDNGTYLNPQSRAGIFQASDADVDGLVSREEYVENRRITDEAKAIMAKADTDGDGRVTRMEFVRCFGVERATLAIAIFEKLDTDRDGATVIPEYLRVWGVWARSIAAAESVGGGQYPEARASREEARQAGPRRGPPSGFGPSGGSMPDLLSRNGIRVGDTLPNVTIYTDTGEWLKLHELMGDRYTVIVGGCLTCPQFLSRYPEIETVARDYFPRGVSFYYLYRALAHPENHGYVEPFKLDERLLHIKEAKRNLMTRVPWIADNMANELKEAMGNINNPAFLLRSGGEIVHLQSWSDGAELRKVLAGIFGEVDPVTQVTDLGLPEVSKRSRPGKSVLPRVEVPELMVPLRIDPLTVGGVYYVKLRAEAEPSVLESGSGKIYLGFHVDPIHDVHWNNLVPPMRFEIATVDGTEVMPKSETAPKVDADADTSPREFLVSIRGGKAENPLKLTVDYFACSDEEGWCRKVVQQYSVQLKRDPYGGGVMGRSFLPGRGFGGGQSAGGFHGGPPGGGAGSGPPDPALLFERFDRNQDGRLAESEAPQFLWRRISAADEDKGGTISLEELEAYRMRGTAYRLGPAEPPDADLRVQ